MRRAVTAGMTSLILAALPFTAAVSAGAVGYCAPSGALAATDLPDEVARDDCDLVGRTVTFHGVSSAVPEPGRGLSKIAVTRGNEVALTVWTSHDGVVTIDADVDEVAEPAPASRPLDAFVAAAAPANDGFAAATELAVPRSFLGAEGIEFEVSELTLEPGEPTACEPAATGSVWYRVARPPTLQRIRLQNDFTAAAVYSGSALGNLKRLACLPARGGAGLVTLPPSGDIFVQSLVRSESFVSAVYLFSGEMHPDAPLPCETRAHAVADDATARPPLKWRFNAADRPASLTTAQTLRGIKRGINVITESRNDCGMADRVSAKAEYLGRTRKRATLCSQGRLDGANTVAFGPAPTGMLGMACSAWSIGPDGTQNVGESDIRLTQGEAWTMTPDAPTCANASDLVGVVAHEAGHVFGLGHAGGTDGLNQTMAPSASGCNGAGRTLGRGDVVALRKLY